ncbi:MAG: sigma-70 family RNA polymerase sigma factor [Phycisphaerales bacterium]|nr:sigma-70 family RNA polymerase sigma factor [Phycisphaerales bacterium]
MTALQLQLSLSMPTTEMLEIVARMAPKALRGRLSGRVSRRRSSVQHQDQARQQEAAPAAVHAGKTDEELLVAYREGDRVAFATLVERYRADLVRFLHRFLSSRAAAEDVFQDAFLQVHLAADSFDADRRFKPWLYTIAANKARDFHRKRKRRAAASLSAPVGSADGRETSLVDLLEGPSEGVDSGLLESERQQLVKEVVDNMPAHYREILLLSYFQKLSYNQIADSLQIPLGTVKSRLHASVANFADAWKTTLDRQNQRARDQTN